MIELYFMASFVRDLRSLEKDLADEAVEKMNLLKDRKNHVSLKVHKLRGALSGKWSFSVNYKTRIVFKFLSDDEAVLLAIGDHDVYK
jgi:mRNA-degrading endonuclease YafQ of YafQ-DinJ toxin-antitoxin module